MVGFKWIGHGIIDGLAQGCGNFISNALEWPQVCTKPPVKLVPSQRALHDETGSLWRVNISLPATSIANAIVVKLIKYQSLFYDTNMIHINDKLMII